MKLKPTQAVGRLDVYGFLFGFRMVTGVVHPTTHVWLPRSSAVTGRSSHSNSLPRLDKHSTSCQAIRLIFVPKRLLFVSVEIYECSQVVYFSKTKLHKSEIDSFGVVGKVSSVLATED